MNRKRLLLAALVGILVLSLAYAFWAMPRQETAPKTAKPARSAPKRPIAAKAAPSDDRLHLELLNLEPKPFPGADRDIFRFRGGQAPFPVATTVSLAPPVQEAPPPPPPPPPPPSPEELLRGEVSRLTFLGFLDKGGARSVFLTTDGNVFIVKAGDVFGKNNLLVAREISDKHLVVGWTRGPETTRMELLESDAHKPAVLSSGAATGNSAQRSPAAASRPGGAGFPSRRIFPQRDAVQPATPPEQQDEVSQEESTQDENVQPDEAEKGVQPPEAGVKLEELLRRKLQGGEGNGTKQ